MSVKGKTTHHLERPAGLNTTRSGRWFSGSRDGLSFAAGRFFEGLEPRALFSAGCGSPDALTFPELTAPSASFSSTSGYSPAQAREAYGFNQVSFSSSAGVVPGNQKGLPASDTTYTPHHWWGGGPSQAASTNRSTPDVAYDADPNTGFDVYDSVSYHGASGWQVLGGTSAGAPQWAALVAIADQGRALSGKAPLDGATGTLPLLYAAYGNPGTTQYASYSSIFHDVTTGGTSGATATAGYDQVTGLGTPRAVRVIVDLGGNPIQSTSAALEPGGGVVVATFEHAGFVHANIEHAGVWQGLAPADGAPPDVPGSPTGPSSTSSNSVPSSGAVLVSGAIPTIAPVSTTAAVLGNSSQTSGSTSINVEIVRSNGGAGSEVAALVRAPNSTGAGPTGVGSTPVISYDRPDTGRGSVFSTVRTVAVALPAAAISAPGTEVYAAPAVKVPPFNFTLLAGDVAQAGGTGPGRGASSILAGLSVLPLWSRLSSLFAGDGPIGSPMGPGQRFSFALPGSLLGLAPAGGRSDSGRAWEITAAVCLGIALAGYWYSSATPGEENLPLHKTRRLRRTRDGWELLRCEER